jgi:hypothetical protein
MMLFVDTLMKPANNSIYRLSMLFDVGAIPIHYHLKEIYKSQELQEAATIRNFRTVQNAFCQFLHYHLYKTTGKQRNLPY